MALINQISKITFSISTSPFYPPSCYFFRVLSTQPQMTSRINQKFKAENTKPQPELAHTLPQTHQKKIPAPTRSFKPMTHLLRSSLADLLRSKPPYLKSQLVHQLLPPPQTGSTRTCFSSALTIYRRGFFAIINDILAAYVLRFEVEYIGSEKCVARYEVAGHTRGW